MRQREEEGKRKREGEIQRGRKGYKDNKLYI
jgi:hypothetical protein